MPRSYFPPKSLKEALSIPRAIFEKNAGKPMYRLTLAAELNLKPEATTFRELITASSGYGLTSGSYKAERIELESLGADIVLGKLEPAYDALFSIEPFQKFHEYFATGGTRGIPSEKAAKDFLKDECGIPERQVNRVLTGILQNARDWHLIQDISGGERFVPLGLAIKKANEALEFVSGEPAPATPTPSEVAILESPVAQPAKPTVRIVPTLQLNIEIHISADTPDDKIETIFRNMKKHLLTDEQ
jgi:hypothetical protein